MEKKILLGMTTSELKELVKSLGMPAFTGGQIAKWLYERQVKSIDEMTNLSKQNRQRLAECCEIGCQAPLDAQYSKDGTIKYLFPVGGTDVSAHQDHPTRQECRKCVETVFIPDGDRATLCVSCQVGCKMNCLFCQTGKQGWEGNLSVADILNQIYSLPEHDRLTTTMHHLSGMS